MTHHEAPPAPAFGDSGCDSPLTCRQRLGEQHSGGPRAALPAAGRLRVGSTLACRGVPSAPGRGSGGAASSSFPARPPLSERLLKTPARLLLLLCCRGRLRTADHEGTRREEEEEDEEQPRRNALLLPSGGSFSGVRSSGLADQHPLPLAMKRKQKRFLQMTLLFVVTLIFLPNIGLWSLYREKHLVKSSELGEQQPYKLS
ncbi:hypothetical protein lerEdw1_012161 [Lerista edwardsae]|nr:hypothetical protein lerEdw1_012161 [Lerista edwardsae]